jgi:hypothetical protein
MVKALVGVVVGVVVAASVGAQVAGPSARYSHHMAYDSVRNKVVLFGGTQQPGSAGLQDTWEWDGRTWLQASPANSPLPTWAGAMCFDAQRQECVLFGGYSNSAGADLNTTWTWDGSTWRSRQVANPPPARRHHSMCYDAQRGVTVLLGGVTNNSPANTTYSDLWEWDGFNWTLRNTSTAPSGSANAALSFNSRMGKCVLFSGIGETWTLDSAGWQQVLTANNPPARGTAASWFDASSGQTILHAGSTSSGQHLQDTWAFDGVNWTQINTPSSPSARNWVNFGAVSRGTSGAVLFGGWSGSTPLSDTWEYRNGSWRQPLPYTRSPINGSLYALTPPMTWQQAEAMAIAQGGHLATVRNSAEQNWLWSTFGPTDLWIGLSDAANEGTWTWSSGERVVFTDWFAGEPTGQPGSDEDYVHLFLAYNAQGRWNDNGSSAVYRGIVEIIGGPFAPLTTTTLPTSATPVCNPAHG